MGVLEIDAEGLDATDRRLLAAIVGKFGGGPVGVAALAAILAEEVETVEDVYEPYLLRIGFLDRTPQGRVATDRARAHLAALGYDVPPRRTERDRSLWETTAPGGPAQGFAVPVDEA
jgi:Holliday junction DNA helicase RuvB